MKRRIATILCIILSISLCGCGACKHEEWKEATCTEPKTCIECGATDGEPLGHKWKDATCTEPKTCTRCKETEGSPLGHDWQDATYKKPKTCAKCGRTEGQKLELTESDYKAYCENVSANDLSHNPSDYKGKLIKISGKVFQVVNEINTDDGKLHIGWNEYLIKGTNDELVFVSIGCYSVKRRIVQGDNITFYGECKGTKTYTTLLGKNTVPSIDALYYD